jgi:hypothetical protein
MNMAARNHCSRPMARALHGHNVCAEISPKPLNFQIEDSEKFGLIDDTFDAVHGGEAQSIKHALFWFRFQLRY